MRQIQLRTLAAHGITLHQSIKIGGLHAHQAQDARGMKLIVVSAKLLGTSWVSIGHILKLHNLDFTIMPLDRPHILAQDSNQLRAVLEVIELASKRSRRDELFITDVGFLVSSLSRTFDRRVLIAPALMLLLTLGLATTHYLEPGPPEEPQPQAAVLTCALDMEESEFSVWLQNKISGREAGFTKESLIETGLGDISLKVEQAIGSTQFVTGVFRCEDGRSRRVQFRTDSEPGRGLVDLGSNLDT